MRSWKLTVLFFTASFFLSPVIFFFRIIRPMFWIRIGRIRTDRIGHLAGNMDRHFNFIKHNTDSKTIDFYYVHGFISNKYLLKMWSRKVKIVQGFLSYFLFIVDIVNSMIPGGNSHKIPELNYGEDNLNYYSSNAAHLIFNEQEQTKGLSYLKSVGISKIDNFICFCVRDDAYMSHIIPNQNFSYHDYRNASLDTHVAAVGKFMHCNNSYMSAIRMGSVVESPISENSKIIDYSLSDQTSDFLDLYLASKCKLFLNSGSGFSAVPRIFKTSLVAANLAPMGYIGSNPIVFIPKKYWHINEKRFLTFKEILQSNVGYYLTSNDYINNGIELIENTDNEIFEALIEAEKRLSNTWNPTEEEVLLQQKFQNLFLPNPLFPSVRAPISLSFLKDNEDLLSDA